MNKYVCHALSQAAIFKMIKLIPKINLKPKKMIGAPFVFAINWDRLHAASLIAVTLFILSVLNSKYKKNGMDQELFSII